MNIKNKLHHQPSMLTHCLCKASIVAVAIQVSTVTLADNVKMYSQVPSANEMAKHLFPKKPKRLRTRSISFEPVANKPSFDPIDSIPQTTAESVGIGLPIQFGFNSDQISSDSRAYIDELGKMLSRADLQNEKVVIEGHTDASGSSQYNQQLSMRRAEAVKQYLFKQYNIDRNRLLVSGKGEYQPLNGRNPFEAVNRRVEIHKFQ